MSRQAEIPATAVSDAALSAALERALGDYFSAPRRIVELARRPSDYRTSFALEELTVLLDEGTTLRLIFKDLSWQTLPESISRVKPAFLYNPLREIAVYRSILAPNRISAPTCYGAVVDERRGRYWLFLERAPGAELYQIGDFAVWQQVARWLASLHAHFSQRVEAVRRRAPLLDYNADFYWLWMRRAQEFARRLGAGERHDEGRGLEWLAARYAPVVERLAALPATFIHGEFYASNALVSQDGGALRVCPVDWEMAATGPGLMDLAALAAGKWSEEEKIALALAYYVALPPVNGHMLGTEEFIAAFDCCRLALAAQWLGWSPEWQPPPEHTQDWLREALFLAEKLSL